MKVFLTVLHWVLNVALVAAGVTCVVLGITAKVSTGSHVGLFLTGAVFLVGAGMFIRYTLKNG